MALTDAAAVVVPAGFELEETRRVYRAPEHAGAVDLRSGRKVAAVRPNIVVHVQRVPQGASVDQVATQRVAELMASLPGMEQVDTAQLTFAHGGTGRVISYVFAATQSARVRQYQALDLAGGTLVSLTLTVDAAGNGAGINQEHLAWLAAALPATTAANASNTDTARRTA